MPTKAEQSLAALETLLDTALTGVTVDRNITVPEDIPDAGLVVIRDGTPEAEELLAGGARNTWYKHPVEIELYVEHGVADTRDTNFDTLLLNVGTALESDLTLGGLIAGMIYERPDTATEPVEGAADIKTATILVQLDYETTTPLG